MLRARLNRNREDHIYLNATIHNSTDQNIFAEYSIDIQEDYLPRAGDFYVTVVRFDIPNTFPIFHFKDGSYAVTLTYGGNDYQSIVQFQNVDMNQPGNRNVWTFQQFVDMINQAFVDAFTALKAANPGAPQTAAPYMTYDSSSSLFSLWTEDTYDETAPNSIQIWFNDALMRFFAMSFTVYGYGLNNLNGKDFRFKITDNRTISPVAGYYQFTQSVETLYQWYDFESIVVATSDIPVLKEYKTFLRSDGRSVQSAILTDFIPGVDKDRSNFSYNANPYRLIDLDGNLPLKRFSFRILWVDRAGVEHLYTLPPNYTLSVKFGFFRKYID